MVRILPASVMLLLTSCGVAATLGCQALEAPLAPTPSPDATVVQFFVACGQWTSTGANCTAHGIYSDTGQRDLTTVSEWESSDTTLARVSLGRVTFLAPGIVTIRAVYQPFTASDRLSTVHSGRP